MVPQYDDDYYYDDPVEVRRPTNRNWMVSLSLATILALIVIGDTIGGLVTVNNRTHIEFGQGVVLTVPCDSNGLTVKPEARYADNNGTREFLFDSLTLSNISDQCLNKLFQFKFYTLSGTSPIVIGEKNIDPANSTSYLADAVRFILSRTVSTDPFDAGLYWSTWKDATSIGSPPNDPSFPSCGGAFDAVKEVNLNYSNSDFLNPTTSLKVDCLGSDGEYNNILSRFKGFLTVPGNDGSDVAVDIGSESYGNTELWIDGLKRLSINADNSSASTTTTTVNLRRGESYPFEYWVLKKNNPLVAKLYWNIGSNGVLGSTALIPRNALTTDYLSAVKIAPTEGTTDYSVSYTSLERDNREIKVQFVRPIQASQIQYLTVETS